MKTDRARRLLVCTCAARVLLFAFLLLVARTEAQEITGWGSNDYGQLSPPAGLWGVKAVAGSGQHSLALTSGGSVVAWGDNTYGQTTVPAGLTGVVAISAGFDHSMALKSDGSVVVWGRFSSGTGTVPAGLSGVVAISAGYSHWLALKSDGTVVAWGMNTHGQTTVPAGLTGVVAISAGFKHSLALKSDGSVVAWGANGNGQTTVPAGLTGVRAIAAGYDFSLALKSDGTVAAWGYNAYGQTTVPAGLTGVVAISAGQLHSLALKSDGSVVAWGDNSYGQTTVPAGLTGVRAIAAGYDFSLALTGATAVRAWGSVGEITNVPPGLAGVTAIAAGLAHSVALKSDGTVVAWGRNSYGQSTIPAGLSGVRGIAAGREHSLALKSDGSVVAWGWNNTGQAAVPAGLSGVKAIAAGWSHSLALKSDGTVVAWGYNGDHQTDVPAGLSGVKAIAAGTHSLALKSDGTVVAWGANNAGQTTVPAGLSGVVAISGGTDYSLALKSDGTVVAWGDNRFGETTVPAGLTGVAAIATGPTALHGMAVKSDGTAVAWGENSYGQSTIPAGLSGVLAGATAWSNSLVLGANLPPTVGAAAASVSVDEGATATNSGTYSDPNGLPVTLAASVGSITRTGTTSGTWSWSLATTDGPAESQTVTITAAQGGLAGSASFTLTVNNLAPVIAGFTGPAAAVERNSNAGFTASFTDAGSGDTHTCTFAWGDGTPAVTIPAVGGSCTQTHAFPNAGAYTVQVAVRDDDGGEALASVAVTVLKTTPAITWATPAAITYGTALSAAQLNATTGVAGTFVYNPAAGAVLTAGSQTLNVTFTPTDTANYNGNTASVSLLVNKATPAITWATPAAITYGTALSATQLNATASVAGSLVYNPAAGAVLSAGSQTLNVTFTPTDTGNYNGNTASVSLLVNKVTPAITWATPAAITYRTALSATQLNATAGVPGAFVYSPAAGAVLSGGVHTLSVTFTPTDTTNYLPATRTVVLQVLPAAQSIGFAPIPDRWGGDPAAVPLRATASSGLPVTFVIMSGPATIAGNAAVVTGPGRIVVRALQEGDGNYARAEPVDQSFLGATYWVTIQTDPNILTIVVDGQTRRGMAFLWEPGSKHRIAVSPFQIYLFTAFRFVGWADSPEAEREITVPASDVTYVARFVAQNRLTVEVKPEGSGAVAVAPESATGYYDAGSAVRLTATAAAGYHFTGYSGDVTSSDAVITVLMTNARRVTANFAGGPRLDAVVSAASFRKGAISGASLSSLFGSGLGNGASATALPLPTTLGGSTLTITDRNGAERTAGLLFVSSTQVNFLAPEGLAAGPVTLRLTTAGGQSGTLEAQLVGVIPGLFTAAMNGSGAAAGSVLRVTAGGRRVESALAHCTAAGVCECVAIDFGAAGDEIFVTVYGTGLRGSASPVQVTVGGVPVEVTYVGAHPQYMGLDQINFRLPRSLAGRGESELVATVDGQATNAALLRL